MALHSLKELVKQDKNPLKWLTDFVAHFKLFYYGKWKDIMFHF